MRAKPPAAQAGEKGRCEIFPVAMLRTPIRSYRRFLDLGAAPDLQQALLTAYREPLIRRALRVKSRSLFAALDRHERGAASLDEDTLFSLYRYFARITTRCTPLMLFAGVGAAEVGEFTQALQASEADWRLGIFPSGNSILRVTRSLLQSAAVRHAARYRISETVVPRGGVLCYFTEQEPEGSKILTPRYKVVAMRLDPQLLPLIRDPARCWSWSELVAVILAAQPGATEALAEQYIFSMLDGGVLSCSLEPPSIGARPERFLHTVAESDAALPELLAQSRELLAITDSPLPVADASFDAAWVALEQHPWVLDAGPEPLEGSGALRRGTVSQAVLRIDARAGGISRTLVAQLGELISRTRGLWSHRYAVFRQAIAEHFADGSVGRRIPLLELTFRVAKGAGLDDMFAGLPLRPPPKEAPAQSLDSYLLSRFLDADLAQAEQIELDLAELNQVLQTTGANRRPDPPAVVESMFRCFHLNGRAVLQHSGTTSYVGSLLNRFLHWNDADPILLQLQSLWRREEMLAHPAIVAEVTCGGGGRLRDLSQRPLTYKHQIVVNGQPSVAREYQIQLHELSVFMGEGGPTLWWEREAVPIIARQLSALHSQALSPVVHVLLALSAQATDWGLHPGISGLPVRTARLFHGDIVLQPQSWLLLPSLQKLLERPQREPARLRGLLQKWRERYQVPRLVRLGDAEHNVVDLDNPLSVRELAAMVKDGRHRVFEEHLEATSPIGGDDGPLVGEAVVHLRLPEPPAAPRMPPAEPKELPRLRASLLETPAARQAHVFYPGAPWLFLKLYYGPGLGSQTETRKFIDDDLLGRFVAPLMSELEKAGRLSGFHFVRYADPEAHLRLRLLPKEGTALALLEQLRERLERQAQAGGFSKWVVATYEREADRYGGPELIAAAERLFTSDSRLCLRILAAVHKDALDPEIDLQVLLPIRSLNTLYRAFGFDLAARRDCFSQLRRAHEQARPLSASAKSALDVKYRQHSRAAQSLILAMEGHDAGGEAPFSRRKDVAAWFRVYEQAAREIAAVYLAAEQRGTCSRPISEVLQSISHLHCNRLLGALELEYEAIYLCQRAVEAVHARLRNEPGRQVPGRAEESS